MKSGKIALIKNDGICYGGLIYYLEQIASVFTNKGYQTEYVDFMDASFWDSEWDAVIGIHQLALCAKSEEGDFIFDRLGCPLFELIIDPPYHLHDLLNDHPKNMHLICLDEGHVLYSRRYYPPFQSVEMGYILGSTETGISYGDRKIDVFFSGTKGISATAEEEISKYPQTWVADLFHFLLDGGKKYPNVATEKMVLLYFKMKNIQISESDYRLAMSVCGTWSEFWLRGYYRNKIMTMLMEAGISVTVAGSGWEEFVEKYPGQFHWKGSLDYTKTGQLMADAKISLNVMPWFKDGMHDRIPTSMHCGAVCVTDGSSYINSHFSDGEDVVLFDLEKLEELPEKIVYILEHEDIAEEIAEKGHGKALKEYTWANMVEKQMLQYIE